MEMRGPDGGCCIARYGAHHHNSNNYPSSYNLSQMDQIMLRYRPIAPKPVQGGGVPGSGPLKDEFKGKGKKRGVSNRVGGKRNKKYASPDRNDIRRSGGEERCHVVTLPLLPETPDLVSPSSGGHKSSPTWLSFGGSDKYETPAQTVVVSRVIVEGVTDTWLDGNGLGRTDEERVLQLEEDTCPGFISDGWNRVWWTNEAYRRMVETRESNRQSAVVVVQLGLKDKVELPGVKLFPAFTCRVRVQYGRDGSRWMTVPCDVWRMEGGGFAWRLDVNTALSLGR